MTIQYCSDLHLEFKENSAFLLKNPIIPKGDILILAGDITYLRPDFYQHPFFDYVSEHWKNVYWVPGNHEFYCGIEMLQYDFCQPRAIRHNVFLVNDISVNIDGINFIFSTLWSKLESRYETYIERNISDFECIVYNHKKLNAKSFNLLHKQSLDFLKKELQKLGNEPKVVVTHHLPAQGCNASEFIGSKINSAFSTDLTSFIETCGADYWIYAHSHRNKPEFRIGQTTMLTNQLGYIQLNESAGFQSDRCFNL